ncbi:MAG: DUF5687 family protein [Candidatus Marinimicrobia bacterium]|nr:DUF5687 family protein [Candidatus Neomarinimicrobiota bacterium]
MDILQNYLSNNFKQFFRSKQFASGLIGKILMALFVPYLVLMSFQMNYFLKEIAPNQTPVETLNSFLLYVFIMFFISGLIFQKIPFDSIKQYLNLNIRKAKITHILLFRTIFGLKSLIIIALFTPFTFISVTTTHSIGRAIIWLLNLYLLIFSINLLIQTIKLAFQKSAKIAGIIILLLVSSIVSGHFGLFNINNLSSQIFSSFLYNNLSILLSLSIFIMLYYVNCKMLISEFYIDKIQTEAGKIKNNAIYDVADKFIADNRFVKFNLKQIFRTKRGKHSYIFTMSMALILGIFVFPDLINDGSLEGSIMKLFFIYLLSGIFIYQHLNFFFALDSEQVDFIQSGKIVFKKYILGRITAVIILTIPIYILFFSLSVFYNGLLLPVISALFYNIGYSSFALTLFAIFSIKKIDVNQTIFMNRQGETILHYLSILIIFIPPLIIFLLFQDSPQIAYIINGLLGVTGIFLSDKWLDIINNKYQERKYKILEELR